MINLNKGLAALGIILFFCLGAITLSFAAPEPSSAWYSASVALRRALKDHGVQVDRDALKTGIVIEAKGLPNPLRQLSDRGHDVERRFPSPRTISLFTAVHSGKVSIQILQSVLNL